MDYHHGKFVWFEHLSPDIPKASAFYDALFGWRTNTVEIPDSVPSPMIHHGGHGIGGFREAPAGTAVRWMPYLSVPDIDASFWDAIAAGGKPLMPPIEYGAVGCGAVLADPTGAEFVIWQSTRGGEGAVAGGTHRDAAARHCGDRPLQRADGSPGRSHCADAGPAGGVAAGRPGARRCHHLRRKQNYHQAVRHQQERANHATHRHRGWGRRRAGPRDATGQAPGAQGSGRNHPG